MVLLLDITNLGVSNAKFSANRNPAAYIVIGPLQLNTSRLLKRHFRLITKFIIMIIIFFFSFTTNLFLTSRREYNMFYFRLVIKSIWNLGRLIRFLILFLI
jgi:Na+/alanine symporter